MVVFDGAVSSNAMLATQNNEYVHNQTLRAKTIIKVMQYTAHNVQGKALLVIQSFNILGQGDEGASTSAPPQQVKPEVKPEVKQQFAPGAAPSGAACAYPAPHSPSAFMAGSSSAAAQQPPFRWAPMAVRRPVPCISGGAGKRRLTGGVVLIFSRNSS